MPKSNANLALKGLDEMFSTEESRQEQKREQVQQIPIEELFPFKEHPFKVLDDEAMQRTVESVAQYAALPRMVMMTYKIPESIQQIAKQGEYDEFDLNVFFSAKGKGRDCRFVYEDYVQKWLDLMRCSYLETTVDELKLGAKKPALPFADSRLLNVLQHTLWFLPNVASCYAMANLLADRKNTFYHDYRINVCAGTEAGIGAAALEPVQRSMGDPLETKTITLSCGKLTTGVTVKPWTGIFMLRNLSSPETYFQAAFRVQSPWEVTTDKGQKEIIKKECYVFDFALNRALRQISDYSCRLNIHEGNPEKKVAEFINFLPVIAYDGSSMRQINAGDILDIAMAGTSATLLAKRWESVLLVNVDNETLSRLIANKEAMDALMKIEGFRSLNSDIETIIAKSEKVKKAKKEGTKDLTPKQKKELSDEEKEYKSKRKQIQEKLIKFATRIPVFMYLTDYRERCLKDVITQLEPGLFKKVTGLSVKDFELLVSLGVLRENKFAMGINSDTSKEIVEDLTPVKLQIGNIRDIAYAIPIENFLKLLIPRYIPLRFPMRELYESQSNYDKLVSNTRSVMKNHKSPFVRPMLVIDGNARVTDEGILI